jgi:ApaG domain
LLHQKSEESFIREHQFMMRGWQCCLAAAGICAGTAMPTIPSTISSFVVRPVPVAALTPVVAGAIDLKQQSSQSTAVETRAVAAKTAGDTVVSIEQPSKSTVAADAAPAVRAFDEQHTGEVEHVEHSKPGFVSPTKKYSSLSNERTGDVEVTARSEFSSHMSRAADNYGVWTYNIAITNHGDKPIRLLSRHWDITTLGPDKQQSTAAPDGFGILGTLISTAIASSSILCGHRRDINIEVHVRVQHCSTFDTP